MCWFAWKGDGTVWAWDETKDILFEVNAGPEWKAIFSRWGQTVALRNDGTLWSWDWNTSGFIFSLRKPTAGISYVTATPNTNTFRPMFSTPAQFGGDSNWAGISEGVGWTTDGRVYSILGSSPARMPLGASNLVAGRFAFESTAFYELRGDGALW